LGHFFGRGRFAQHSQEIAVNRPVITEHQLLPGDNRRLSRALVRLQPDRQPRLDAAQPLGQFIRFHGISSGGQPPILTERKEAGSLFQAAAIPF